MMAETVEKAKSKLGWSKKGMDSSEDSDSDAYIPGVNNMGNLRPKLRGRRTQEIKPRIPIKQPSVEDVSSSTSLSVHDLTQSLDERKMRLTGGVTRNKVSLKDLCVEDKQRIANLIKELAKVGEEREKAREELDKERRQYEEQILKLIEQQEQILKERHEVENQLVECQTLLAQCQVQKIQTASQPPQHQQVPAVSFQDTMQSLYANVGSPRSNLQRPVTAMIDREIAQQRYQHGASDNRIPNYHSLTPVHVIRPSGQNSHQDPRYNLMAGGDYYQTQQQDFLYANQLQSGNYHAPVNCESEFGKFYSAEGAQLWNNSKPPQNTHGSKEEIMNRFLDSQPANIKPETLTSQQRPQAGSRERRKSPQRIKKNGPFLPPIMSSTQKSAEIKEYLSVDSSALLQQEFTPLVPDDSPRSSADDDDGGEDHEDKINKNNVETNCVSKMVPQVRVVFSETDDKEYRLHSPQGDGGEDKHYVKAFRKLSETERKQQLLQQRAQLLEEQKRLKQILSEQEAMLKEKQQALAERERRDIPADVMDRDPLGLVPQRLAIDAALERQRAIVDSLEAQKSTESTPRQSARHEINLRGDVADRREQIREDRHRTSGKRVPSPRQMSDNHSNTFIVQSNKLSDIARKLDYSFQSDKDGPKKTEPTAPNVFAGNSSDECREGDDDEEEGKEETEDEDNVERVDTGTSVSYRNIPRSSHSPLEKVHSKEFDEHRSHLPNSHKILSPGEKTLSVLEIINSLQDNSAPRLRQSPGIQFLPSSQPLFSTASHTIQHKELSPFHLKRREIEEAENDLVDSSENSFESIATDNEGNEELEESQILEEIFFLK